MSLPHLSSSQAVSPELGAWDTVRHGWRQLYGDVFGTGISIEAHQFRLRESLDWRPSFHRDSVELCLNLQGRGWVRGKNQELLFQANEAGFYLVTDSLREGRREAGDHFFLTLEMRAEFFLRQSAFNPLALQPQVAAWLNGAPHQLGHVGEMTIYESELAKSLIHPPVAQTCRALWYQGKIMEIMAHFLFSAPPAEEWFCSRQKRATQDRVEQVATLLRNNLENPPDLETMARQIGCSATYLSRRFSEVKGITISQYLRRVRLEKAAELLRTGNCNVTEAAMSVGYSSLSHFSKGFREVYGCNPQNYG
jgi:AraC family transcriptional regulator